MAEETTKPKRKYVRHKPKANPTNHGGAREGAGRPKLDQEPTTTMTIRIPESVKSKYKQLQSIGAHPEAQIIKTINDLALVLGITA